MTKYLNMLSSARRFGKTFIAEMWEKEALDDGKTVLSFTQNGILKKKKHDKFVLIVPVDQTKLFRSDDIDI